MKNNYQPVMTTDKEKTEYFEDLVYLVNDEELKEERDTNLTNLKKFLRSNREFSEIKMFRRKHGFN